MRPRRTARQLLAAIARAPGRLRQLSLGELALLVQTPMALPLAALALDRFGLHRTLAFLDGRPRARAADDARRRGQVERLAWIVKVSAMYGPWPANCLQRSVVLWWYLRIHAFDGDLRIGVRRNPHVGGLDFHAWIEHQGAVLNDDPDVRVRFATFDRAIAPRDARFR